MSSAQMRALWLAIGALIPGNFCGAAQWQQGAGFRSLPLEVGASTRPGFTRISPAMTGITFTNPLSSARYLTNQVLLNGSGVALGDIDGDGRVDLYFCALDGPNALYRNLGDWKFEDITASAGVACANLDATGAVLADVDGDGDLDLLVNTVGQGTHCFLNDGKGRFTGLTAWGPLNPLKCGTTMALADIDGDGDLHLYVANYRADTRRHDPNTRL